MTVFDDKNNDDANNNTSTSSRDDEDEKDWNTNKRRNNDETGTSSSNNNNNNNKKKKKSIVPLQVAPVIQQQQQQDGQQHHDNKSILATKYSSGQVCTQQPIIILLDQATLETIKNNRNNNTYELLNCDDHRDICKKKLKQDPNNYRPDIVHQVLLSIIDSPINKCGLVKIYIKTTKNILIDVNPLIRIPRTYKRFAGLMVQLLHTMKIKSTTESSTTLLRIIKNPFQQYLLPNTIIYGLECSGTLYSPISFVQSKLASSTQLNNNNPICFIIGAMSNGNITYNDHPYIQEMIKLSEYPLSGAAATSRLLGAIEHHWGII